MLTCSKTGTLHVMTSAWAGAVARFLDTSRDTFLAEVAQGFTALTGQLPGPQQSLAWEETERALRAGFAELVAGASEAGDYHLVLEFELPLEGGRRPDVLLLTAESVIVLEVKANKLGVYAADLDQVAAYARDLRTYHAASHDLKVIAALLPTAYEGPLLQRGEVSVFSPGEVASWLKGLDLGPAMTDPEAWLRAAYAPLPSVVQAARRVFNDEPLPKLRQAESAGVPVVLDFLAGLSERAKTNGERHIVIVTGVPGAGKTLVGLNYVYAARGADDQADALFLSGNGPLVQVLQYALKSKTFVRPIRNFYIQYAVKRQAAPPEHFIVFDEAQRAWDASRMGEKYGQPKTAPELITEIASRVPDYALVLALIGEGQEIHIGEEEGLEQWGRALETAPGDWTLHAPGKFAGQFAAAGQAKSYDFLDLNTSLRSHLASDVQRWVARVLEGDFEAAEQLAGAVRKLGFNLYLSRDLAAAKAYCQDRYAGEPGKRYGFVASSKAKNLAKYGVHNDYQSTLRVKVGPFFVDPPASPLSCCQFEAVVTEFGCQGLELDLPVVCWGTDLRLEGGTWVSPKQPRSKAKDPHRLRVNAYRVLLTRGRDGLVLFVPPDGALDETYNSLLEAGAEPLEPAGEGRRV